MFDPLKIHSKNFLPEVVLDKDKGIFIIKGKSIPEDSSEFYSPVFKWFEVYFENPNPETVFFLQLDYYNSSSARAIANLIKLFDDKFNLGVNVKVIWSYNPDDEAMKENGEDFSLLFSLPIEINPY
ncbi:MAG: DUF1987 domain-containing protein [Bacteroidales bacterium]|nr:DUF1987 domain-containing protein [Bacteroidales bacterium]